MKSYIQYKRLASIIASKREELNMSQRELARRAMVSPQTISSTEKAKHDLRLGVYYRICLALELAPAAVLATIERTR